MNAAERAQRDALALQLFIAGATYQQIADRIGLKSRSAVHHIVQRELGEANERRKLLTDEAFSMFQERTERLFQAHWGLALKGDHKSAAICQRLLAQQSRLYGLDAEPAVPLPAVELDDEEELDELAQLRSRRSPA
jgi:hypothetical protein